MKVPVVVVLCALLPFTGWPLLTGPWLLNSISTDSINCRVPDKNWQIFPIMHNWACAPAETKWLLPGWNSVWIECEFVAVVSWKVGWLWFFLHKICTRPIGRLVSQFYSSLGCFYPSGTTGRVVSSNIENPSFSGMYMQNMTEYDVTNISDTRPRKNMITMGKVDMEFYDCAYSSLMKVSKHWIILYIFVIK